MKTKTDTLRLWKSAYNIWSKAIKDRKKTKEIEYSIMLIAYENVLEMNRSAIKKKLKLE